MRPASPVPPHSPNFQQAVQHLVDDRPPQAVQAIYSAQGVKLIERGTSVDGRLYERLMQHSLQAPLHDLLLAQDSVSGKNLRAQAERLIARRPVLAYLLAHGQHTALLLDALEHIPLPPPVAFQLSVARDVHPALFQYTICTALVAGWLALGEIQSRYDLGMVMAAGLLQDLGMMHVDPVLLQPKGELSPAQRRQLYSHPLVSALLLERHHEYPSEMIRAVREHHELLDGSGYPARLVGEKISPWGRTVSLAQTMSALLRPGRGLSGLRLSMLLRTNRHLYEPALCDRALKVLREMAQDSVPASATELATLEPVLSPSSRLIAIDEVLADWPAALERDARLPAERRSHLAGIGQHCAQLRRLLADAGASGDQLAMLGAEQDESLLEELSLIAREVAWQLRALARNASQPWGNAAAHELPPALAAWIGQVRHSISGLVGG